MGARSARIARVTAAVALSAPFLVMQPVVGEPVIDRVLSGSRVSERNGCALVHIDFNIRVRYVSHFPLANGRQLRIKVRPIDPLQASREVNVRKESIRAPLNRRAAIRSIEFEVNGTGPVVNVLFREPVSFRVAQGDDFRSILLTIASSSASPACKAEFAAGLDGKPPPAPPRVARRGKDDRLPTAAPDRIAGPPAIVASPGARPSGREPKTTADLVKDARAALTAEEYDRAIRLLTKAVNQPETRASPEALELLGLARERKGQNAHAKAEYEQYLKKYPKGAAAARVRQRLAAILTGDEKPRGALRQPVAPSGRKTKPRGLLAARPEKPREPRWEASGSLSQFYFRNHTFRKFTELESRRKTEEDDVLENSLLSGVDLNARYDSENVEARMRFSGTYEKDFADQVARGTRVSSAYLQGKLKRAGLEGRIGRQRRSSGGILSRFDGLYAGWQATDKVKLNGVLGSPVDSSRDEPFRHDRYLAGVSVDLGRFHETWDTTLFFVNQTAGSFTDRQAVGAEFRYFDANKSVFATVDYDLHFNRLNYASASGSWTSGGGTTFSFAVDHVTSPTLATLNALQGQNVDTLDRLNEIFSKGFIKELAKDRTTESTSANFGVSTPLNDVFQFNADVTVIDTSGTKASGGVPASPAPGLEYFASAQLIGTGIFAESDVSLIGFRYAHTLSSDLYLVDAYTRYPLNDSWWIRPRLKLGYRTGNRTDFEEYMVLPTLTTNYRFSRNWSFEFDVGGRWSQRNGADSIDENLDLYLTAGFRYDFQYSSDR